MILENGRRLGPYEILSPLGVGGMGEVWRARDHRLNRDVALKVLPGAIAGDPATRTRFEREAKAVAALSHPNILAIHDFGTIDGTAFAVMELLEGQTLRERLAGGALPASKTAGFAVQLAHGLAAAHDKGIVHRDVKPENVFITNDGRLKILDFRLARVGLPRARRARGVFRAGLDRARQRSGPGPRDGPFQGDRVDDGKQAVKQRCPWATRGAVRGSVRWN
ncbi:MAG: serine/threonine-protein kinase [Thermoanaerobaculaceae bacterium]|jgi:serine/threonine protein kinase